MRAMANSTLRGLQRNRNDQRICLQRTTKLMCFASIVILSLLTIINGSRHSDPPHDVLRTHSDALPTLKRLRGGSYNVRNASTMLGNFRIVSDEPTGVTEPSPSSNVLVSLAPVDMNLPLIGDQKILEVGEDDFGLPKRVQERTYPQPPWRSSPDAHLATEPHARLVNPAWPRDAWIYKNDTVTVAGHVTLHRTGRVTFVLTSRNSAFAREVTRAMSLSSCVPATDHNGNTISMQYAYRCLFMNNARPSAHFSKGATAIVKEPK